ncbi:MAG: SMI1/KNR4 family protein [Gemmataceae bacterium]|nr:SMI1/KNR4 family protein [Gemmataceae bacterium]MCI0738155.1 SMI1/KNR4 family protein [Gemmataceae bacterium]
MFDERRISKLLAKAKKWRTEPLPEGIADEKINAFMKKTGIVVPDDLRKWLKTANGAWVGPGGIFGIRPQDPFLDIESRLEESSICKKKKWIPVAGDGCGNSYIMPTDGDLGAQFPILFVNSISHEMYVVGSDLCHFLVFLLEADLKESELVPNYKKLLEKGDLPNLMTYPVGDPVWSKWPFDKQFVVKNDPAILKLPKSLLPWEVDRMRQD